MAKTFIQARRLLGLEKLMTKRTGKKRPKKAALRKAVKTVRAIDSILIENPRALKHPQVTIGHVIKYGGRKKRQTRQQTRKKAAYPKKTPKKKGAGKK